MNKLRKVWIGGIYFLFCEVVFCNYCLNTEYYAATRRARNLDEKNSPLISDVQTFTIGIDIGGTKIAIGIINPSGNITARIEIPTPKDVTKEDVVDYIAEHLVSLLIQHNIDSTRIDSIGIGFPGYVNNHGIVKMAPNMPMFIRTELYQLFQDKLLQKIGMEKGVFIDNDASAAALAEAKFGAGVGVEKFTYLTISTGIGGAIVDEDVVTNIESGNTIFPDSARPNKKLIDLASGKALIENARVQIEQYLDNYGEERIVQLTRIFELVNVPGNTIVEKIKNLTTKDLAEAALKGDIFSQDLFQEAGRYIGLGIAELLQDDFPEEMIVLGGGVLKAGDILLNSIKDTVKEQQLLPDAPLCLKNFDVDNNIILGEIDDRGILGAALLTPEFSFYSRQELIKLQNILETGNNLVLINGSVDLNQVNKYFTAVIKHKGLTGIKDIVTLNLWDLYNIEGTNFVDAAKKMLEQINKSAEGMLVFVEGIELLLENGNLKKYLNSILINPNLKVFGATTFKGYRTIEAEKDLAGKLNFVIKQKNISESLRNKKVLVIGASGFLGRNIFAAFSDRFNKVIGTSFTSDEFTHLDLTNPEQIRGIILKFRPDIVIYAARPNIGIDAVEKDHADSYKINVKAVEEIARNFQGKFIYISSDYVFDGENPPYATNAQVEPLSQYAKSKLRGEQVVQEYFSDYIIVRSGIMFGYQDVDSKPNFMRSVLKALEKREIITADSVDIRHPVLVDDVSALILNLISYDTTGIYHINGNVSLTYYEWARKIAEVFADFYGLTVEEALSYVQGEDITRAAPRPYNPHLINSDAPTDLNTALLAIKIRMIEGMQR